MRHRRPQSLEELAAGREAALVSKIAGIVRRLDALCESAAALKRDMSAEATALRRLTRQRSAAKARRV
jgi:hypothetical protein